MGIASIVAVALRFKARIMAGTVFGLDDWLIIPSLVLHTVSCLSLQDCLLISRKFFTLCICAANIVGKSWTILMFPFHRTSR